MTVTDMAVAEDGTLYIADQRNGRIRAIGTDGIITTVAGGGPEATGYEDGKLGKDVRLFEPLAVEVGPAGEVYFGDSGGPGNKVRRIDTDGKVTTVAGANPFDPDDNGDGGPAREARMSNPQGLSLGRRRQPVRRREPAACAACPATASSRPSPAAARAARRWHNRVPAGSVKFAGAAGVDLAHDGALYVASMSGLSRVSRPFPRSQDGKLAIPSKDGREVYRFDAIRPAPQHAERRQRRHDVALRVRRRRPHGEGHRRRRPRDAHRAQRRRAPRRRSSRRVASARSSSSTASSA